MMRHRGGAPSSESSSDEEDAFSALSRKKKGGRKKSFSEAEKKSSAKPASPESENVDGSSSSASPAATKAAKSASTSSMKRHHGTSDARKAKMDALLQELQAEKDSASKPVTGVAGHYGPAGSSGASRPPPDKRGSYVEPGEEHLTTNIFVGNLAPSVTEEALTDLFRQFGDLYSVKIMWPRTAEERARNRNTGFVCFMVRADAQEAMDAFNDSDPLKCGRRMVLRWGKNVKKTVKRGTGGVPIPPIRKKGQKKEEKKEGGSKVDGDSQQDGDGGSRNKRQRTDIAAVADVDVAEKRTTNESSLPVSTPQQDAHSSSPVESINGTAGPEREIKKVSRPKISLPKYDPQLHAEDAIRVIAPSDPHRLKFITTVASFVAKDGSILERKLVEKESNNPEFSFLTGEMPSLPGSVLNSSHDAEDMNERIFYRWRVYAFTQGDGFKSWRTDPFVMIEPHGRFWIPPSLDQEEARREEEARKQKEEDIRLKQEERRKLAEKKDFMTGRQLEHAKFGGGAGGAAEGGAKLTDWEMEQFVELLRKKLCASREAICEAMAFCFDKSGAAKQISVILKEALLDDGPGVSVDTRIARLFLLSDVLFNSQQPGVRNAFRYRDAIEAMAPEVFKSLGNHGKGQAGRMTMNKLRMAVGGVLSAWTNWSVYNPTFLDELNALFEGKEIATTKETDDGVEVSADMSAADSDAAEREAETDVKALQPPDAPRGGWTDAEVIPSGDDVDGEPLEEVVAADADGEPIIEGDVDGVQLEEGDVDGEALEEDDVDGEELADDDVDGEALADDDVDGEALAKGHGGGEV